MQTREPLVIIAGPTAVGKSAAAVELAHRLPASVISADSMQVYRGMDIGTAKITPEEMRGVPHYLIDVVDPWEEWNVVRFQTQAKAAVREIRSQGRLPILVGGTGFYVQALLYDIDFTKTQEDAQYREELARLAREQGPEALHRLLQDVDPESAQTIHPNNVKRVIRALEYARSTGEPISGHNREQRGRSSAYDAVFLCLTMERSRLYERIDARVERMVEQGLEEEVRTLRGMGLTAEDVSMQGLGYRQMLSYLNGECSLQDAIGQIRIQTRHYAKRQITWFKRERNVRWLDVDAYASRSELADEMEKIIKKELAEHYAVC